MNFNQKILQFIYLLCTFMHTTYVYTYIVTMYIQTKAYILLCIACIGVTRVVYANAPCDL